jgi:hypothetical protein
LGFKQKLDWRLSLFPAKAGTKKRLSIVLELAVATVAIYSIEFGHEEEEGTTYVSSSGISSPVIAIMIRF